jgi:hypothetical protein
METADLGVSHLFSRRLAAIFLAAKDLSSLFSVKAEMLLPQSGISMTSRAFLTTLLEAEEGSSGSLGGC